METIQTQALVCGGGSGGFAAAYTLARSGIRTLLIEQNPGLGGTSVFGGVNCYEPGVSSGHVHELLYRALAQMPGAAAVCRSAPGSRLLDPDSDAVDLARYPWGLSEPDPSADYADTLARCLSLTGGRADAWRRLQFEPAAMNAVMSRMLQSVGAAVWLGAQLTHCSASGDLLTEAVVKRNGTETRVRADYFVDATGGLVLARSAGCRTVIGADGRDAYGEPSAGAADPTDVNGVSFVFRIAKDADENHMDHLPEPADLPDFDLPISCFNRYPNGDINVNMLPTMRGSTYLALGDAADAVCRGRVNAYWNRLQQSYGLRGYRLVHRFPMPGIRESYRLCGRYVLTEHDILLGADHQPNRAEIVALADHARDTHGSGGCSEIVVPYGIPLDCLRMREYENGYVACRGASFSHTAASSARLSRTMLALGEAVGYAIAMQENEGKIDFSRLRQWMKIE